MSGSRRYNWVTICVVYWALLNFHHRRITISVCALQILLRISCSTSKVCKKIFWRVIVLIFLLSIFLTLLWSLLWLICLFLRLWMRTLLIKICFIYLLWNSSWFWFRFYGLFWRWWRCSHLMMALCYLL